MEDSQCFEFCTYARFLHRYRYGLNGNFLAPSPFKKPISFLPVHLRPSQLSSQGFLGGFYLQPCHFLCAYELKVTLLSYLSNKCVNYLLLVQFCSQLHSFIRCMLKRKKLKHSFFGPSSYIIIITLSLSSIIILFLLNNNNIYFFIII